MWVRGRAPVWVAGAVLGTAAAVTWFVVTRASAPPQTLESVETADRHSNPKSRRDKRIVSAEDRDNYLTRAHVWQKPRVPVSRARFRNENIPELSCRFTITDLGGTTPKFDCELDDGEEIRIKYGNGPEVPAETAATRLLAALGFGADEVTLVKTLRCYGCPEEPFSTIKAVEITRSEPLYRHVVDHTEYETFEWVSMERKFNAPRIETEKIEGWSFFELDRIDPHAGGAPRAHVDGLRLMAILLAHWDNKAENQRMVCLAPDWPEGTRCARPFLLLQDVGATFGPTKMHLENWEAVPIWADRAACSLSMRSLPFGGATFGQVVVTEAGRRFTGNLLNQLSDDQLTELFTEARFGEKRGLFNPAHPVTEWVRVFKGKVREITDGPPCPE